MQRTPSAPLWMLFPEHEAGWPHRRWHCMQQRP